MRTQLRLLKAVFANPDLRRLQLAWMATSVGVWGGALALSVYAYAQGGAAAVGLVALLRTLPGAAVAPFLAVLADRSPRGVMLASAVARAAVMFALAAAAAADASLVVFDALVVVLALVSPAFAPALVALMPQVARTPLELASANVAESTVDNLGFVGGSLLTGFALASTSPGGALAVLGVAYAVAVVPLLRIDSRAHGAATADDDPDEGGELAAGFRAVAADRNLRELVLLLTVILVVDGALDVLVVIGALGFLHAGNAGASVLTAAWGIGCIAGGVGVMALLSRGRMLSGILAGAAIVGASLASFAASPWTILAATVLIGFGIGYTMIEIAAGTLLQRITPGHVLGRVAGVVETLSVVAIAAGSLGAALLSDAIGARGAILVTAALIPGVVLLRRRAYARMDAGAPVDERSYALLRAHPIFAPLPVATIELLAQRAEEQRPDDGAFVVRQGEAGDRFYLVAEGALDVFVDGAHVRTMGPGDGFGEIALVRESARTASVRAAAGVVLLTLDHQRFLTALAGLSRSRRAADSVTAERLAWAAPAEPPADTLQP